MAIDQGSRPGADRQRAYDASLNAWLPVQGTANEGMRVSVRGGGASIAPTDYAGNVTVSSITGVAIDTIASGATQIRLAVAKVTGTPGALYVAFGADGATAVANVDATVGSEAGMLVALTPADGDEYLISIPAAAQDGGSIAAGTAAYDAGNHEIDLNIVQGV